MCVKIAAIACCKNEPFVHEFVKYYVNEGVDKIFIYDDDSNPGTYDKIDSDFKKYITILNRHTAGFTYNSFTFEQQNITLNYLFSLVQDFDWVINVDIDEYISTRDDRTIRNLLETTYKDVDCIKIPWVMMANNGRLKNPVSNLGENIFRWNHDLRHAPIEGIGDTVVKFRCLYGGIESKYICKPNKFKTINVHFPHSPEGNDDSWQDTVKVVESVTNEEWFLTHFFYEFRESSIEEATLLCYHYRIISLEHVESKMSGDFYKDFAKDKMMQYDFPEIEDHTLRNKAIKYGIYTP